MHPQRLVSILVILVLVAASGARGDDIATMPLGDPAFAYQLGSGEAGQILSCRGTAGANVVDAGALAAELADADVVIVGENHTNLAGHRTQWEILEAIAKSGRAFALGMEFFEIDDDEALGAYAEGREDLATMLDRTGWYAGGSYNFEYYRPLVETCREHRAPIHGLNIPREWVRTVSRQGAAALTPEQREAVGEIGPVDERHKYVVNQMMGGIGAAMPQMFEGMYRGQTAWDAAMATSIARAHRRHAGEGTERMIVVIVGSGHMAHGLGIPARLKAIDPSLKVKTIAPVQGVKPPEDARVHPGFERKETAVFSLGYADYVYILPDVGNAEEYPQVGVRLAHPKDGASETGTPLRIASVTPGSIGARAGLQKDDAVLLIGGEAPTTPRHAGAILGSLRWDERVVWRVRRGDREMEVAMLVVPPTDGEGDWLKSTSASMLLDTFDPASDRSYLQPKGFRSETSHARLVTFRDKPVRVDVLRGGVLMEAWNLDEQGRPVLGLLGAPAADGAVRVEIERDESGKATKVRRLDSAGQVVRPASDPHVDLMK